jgi:hypothetical protein
MELQRGFFRLWVVLSTLWAAGWIIYFATISVLQGYYTDSDFFTVGVFMMALVSIGVPLALLAVGAGFAWAISGFNGPPRGP